MPSERASSGRYAPLAQLIIARLREFQREPAAIFWVYFFPLIMVVALGMAFRNRPVERMAVAVPGGRTMDPVVQALAEDVSFRVEQMEEEACRRALRTGKVDLVVVPGGESEQQYVYVFDPSKPASVLARNAVDDRLQRAAGRQDVVQTDSQEFVEPGGRYIDFLVPGLVGMGLMGGGMWGVGFAIVDMRIRKLLKRYLATPMKRGHFLSAIMISRLLFTVPEIIVLLVFARLIFGVVSYGSYLSVGLLILLGALQFAGIGLLVASRAETLETVSGLMNLVMLPMWIGSGIFFSVERFPETIQPALQVLPLTPLIQSLRSVMLEGVPLWSLGTELAIMLAWGIGTFALALWWFRWS